MKFRYIVAVIVSFIALPSLAESENITGRIIQSGEKFGIELKVSEGWHTYYKDPGEAGVPTEFDWSDSEDIQVYEVTYPKSKIVDENGIKTNAYEGRVFFPVTADIGEGAIARVRVTGAVCGDICIPYEMTLEKKLRPAAQNGKEVLGLSILLTAFLAGLILNVMPCVLPVLSLKVLSVVKQTGKKRSHASINFFATASGIIVSFLVLALLAISLKETGMEFGWGLHFQSPYFVGILMLITLLFGLSLFGLFHLNPPSWLAGTGPQKDSLTGNFVSGVLATLLGTACTAPVVVTAVSFALAGSNTDIILIFLVMGLGMALPFLMFALNPGLAGFLPKPGNWMNKVKMVMGGLLIGTSIWLGTILCVQLIDKPKADEVGSIWIKFDESKIENLVNQGRVVFLDVTAEWCVNCKANKLAVTETEEMLQFFSQNNVVMMQGDMTNPDKELLAYIKTFDRYGIPVNIVFGPGAEEGILLDTILSSDAVKEAIQKAAASD